MINSSTSFTWPCNILLRKQSNFCFAEPSPAAIPVQRTKVGAIYPPVIMPNDQCSTWGILQAADFKDEGLLHQMCSPLKQTLKGKKQHFQKLDVQWFFFSYFQRFLTPYCVAPVFIWGSAYNWWQWEIKQDSILSSVPCASSQRRDEKENEETLKQTTQLVVLQWWNNGKNFEEWKAERKPKKLSERRKKQTLDFIKRPGKTKSAPEASIKRWLAQLMLTPFISPISAVELKTLLQCTVNILCAKNPLIMWKKKNGFAFNAGGGFAHISVEEIEKFTKYWIWATTFQFWPGSSVTHSGRTETCGFTCRYMWFCNKQFIFFSLSHLVPMQRFCEAVLAQKILCRGAFSALGFQTELWKQVSKFSLRAKIFGVSICCVRQRPRQRTNRQIWKEVAFIFWWVQNWVWKHDCGLPCALL